jgi:AraC-like DNA-binding protein
VVDVPVTLSLNLAPMPVGWHVSSYGRDQTIGPRGHYAYDNFGRAPAGLVVFQLVEAGELVFVEEGVGGGGGRGEAVMFTYGERSSYRLKAPPREVYRTTFLNLAGAGVAEHFGMIRSRHGSVIRPDRQVVGGLSRLIDSAMPGSGVSPGQQTRGVHAFVLDLAEHLEGQAQGRATPVGQAVRWILSRPTEDWSLKQLAVRFGCSREHLIRVFFQEQGQTPGQYVAQARLRRALALLLETDLGLKEVAAQSGYRSTHTLARQVVKGTGVSPEGFRARRRGLGSGV